MTLDGPTDSTSVLYECSCRLLKDFWDMTPLRLMGVRAGKINDGSFSQISLFDDPGLVKKKEFEKTVDKIRNKYGIDSIKRASFLQKRFHCGPCRQQKETPEPPGGHGLITAGKTTINPVYRRFHD